MKYEFKTNAKSCFGEELWKELMETYTAFSLYLSAAGMEKYDYDGNKVSITYNPESDALEKELVRGGLWKITFEKINEES